MEGEEEACATRLCLGIGCGGRGSEERGDHGQGKPPVKLHMLFPTRLDTIEEEGAVEDEEKEGDCDGNGNDLGKSGTWKKPTLTKEQSSMLQDIFKERTHVDMMEKHELAEKLNLRPRQVEVWFQNKRARTKSEQMEHERLILKEWCAGLAKENLRLKKELHELKSIERSSPFYHQPPKATATALAMCSSCKKIAMEREMEKKELFGAMEGSSSMNS
ncbi:hypothetical protein AAC387_Pa05g2398 [Persea americana]